MSDAWDALAGFESRDLIHRFFKKRHGIEPNAGKIREIASSFSQGREYFSSASSASISVKPLLLYYGVLSLSRALILCLSPNAREASLKPSHGLEVRNWQPALNNRDFANLELRILNGTFLELLSAVDNVSYYRHNQSSINWQVDFPRIQEGQIITFYELASGFPDLYRELSSWSENQYKRALFKGISRGTMGPNSVIISLYNWPLSDEDIEAMFPEQSFPGKIITRLQDEILAHIPGSDKKPRFVYSYERIKSAKIGSINLVKSFKNADSMSDIGQFFAASYMLGMMSRYFPTTWISLGRGEKGDSVYPFVLKLIKYIEAFFPLIVLDHLDAPYDYKSGQ